MEKINDSEYVSGADGSTISDCTSQLEFEAATNNGILSPETIHTTSGKGNKEPVRKT